MTQHILLGLTLFLKTSAMIYGALMVFISFQTNSTLLSEKVHRCLGKGVEADRLAAAAAAAEGR